MNLWDDPVGWWDDPMIACQQAAWVSRMVCATGTATATCTLSTKLTPCCRALEASVLMGHMMHMPLLLFRQVNVAGPPGMEAGLGCEAGQCGGEACQSGSPFIAGRRQCDGRLFPFGAGLPR